MAAQNGEVGVVALGVFIAVAVDNRQAVVVVIFLADEAAGVLTERAHLVGERLRVADEFGLIQNLVHFVHNFVAHFHAHADVHRAGQVVNAVLFAHFFKPVRAFAAGRNHHRVRIFFARIITAAGLYDCAFGNAVFNKQIYTFGLKINGHAVFE